LKLRFTIAIVFFLLATKTQAQKLSVEEKKLYNLIMSYRKKNKLPAIPLSKSLTLVAQTHANDLANNPPDAASGCNMHSWSSNGKWSSCCFTDNNPPSSCMFDKPRELTNYKGDGYEIAYSWSTGVNADKALQGWKTSPSHNAVIINQSPNWTKKWNAIGIGIFGNYAVAWFGYDIDK
jgi:uncharacterized protein YkwD